MHRMITLQNMDSPKPAFGELTCSNSDKDKTQHIVSETQAAENLSPIQQELRTEIDVRTPKSSGRG